MLIKIKVFASLRDITGTGNLELILPEGSTTDTLVSELIRQFPGLLPFKGIFRIAVNQEYTTETLPLHDRDEVALIPPTSGG